MERANKIFTKRFFALFFTNMSVFLVFYGLVTTLPLYVIGELKGSEDDAGLLVTAFLLSAILVRPFCGKLLDIYGKKRMLTLSVSFYLFCTVLYIFVEPFLLLLALRFFQGIWFSIATTAAGSLAADIVPEKRKGAGLGYFTMSTNLAVVIGPFIGLLVIQYASFDVLFLVLSTIVLVGCGISLTINTRDLQAPMNVERGFKFSVDDLIERKALSYSLLACLLAFSYSSVLSFISIYAEHQNLLAVASYFYAVFAAAMLITRPLTGKIYDQVGPQFVIIPAFILFSIGLFMLASLHGVIMFILSAIFIGIGYGTLTTSLQSQAVQSTTHQRSGYATATYFTFFDIGVALGSYVLGIIAMAFSYEAVYYLAGCLLLLVMILYLWISLNKTKANRML
ncbi:MFS transporter [Lysinibacillus sp. 54212]|uniref:MFS transporter n=1 Tax=Lysinibacillus sp. 54212 TaxID=3119829 RepID=UPI002FCC9955